MLVSKINFEYCKYEKSKKLTDELRFCVATKAEQVRNNAE